MRRAAEICTHFGGEVPADAQQGRSPADANRLGTAGRWRDFFIRAPYYLPQAAWFHYPAG